MEDTLIYLGFVIVGVVKGAIDVIQNKKKNKVDRIQLNKLEFLAQNIEKALNPVVAKSEEDAIEYIDGQMSMVCDEFISEMFILFTRNHIEDKVERIKDIKNTTKAILIKYDKRMRSFPGVEGHMRIPLSAGIDMVLNSELINYVYEIYTEAKNKTWTNDKVKSELGKICDSAINSLKNYGV